MSAIGLELGFLGPEGSHSHVAAATLLKNFVSPPLLTPYPTLSALMEAVAEGLLPLALLPVENVLEGAVLEVLETLGLQRLPLHPLAEWCQPIEHALILPLKAELTQIRRVLSHPQALAQCQEHLKARFGPDLELIPVASSAHAVEILAQGDHASAHLYGPIEQLAALGTVDAALRFGLPVADTQMSDSPDNMTRFLLICRQQDGLQVSFAKNLFALPDPLRFKTSFGFSVPNRPGALVDVLQFFKSFDLDLVRIESRPSRRQLGEYWFFVDVLADATGPAYQVLWDRLQQVCLVVHRLGPFMLLNPPVSVSQDSQHHE